MSPETNVVPFALSNNMSVAEIKRAIDEKVKATEMEEYSIKEVFGLKKELPFMDDIQFRPKAKHPLVRDIKPYVFREDDGFLARVFTGVFNNRPLMLVGETGTGKSSFVEQFTARIHAPLLMINGGPGVRSEHLTGRNTLNNGEVSGVDGVVTHALRHGFHCCIDELSAIRAEELVGLNDCYEGSDLITLKHEGFDPYGDANQIIQKNSIVRHRSARMWATDNTGGKQTKGMGFGKRQVLDASTRSRFSYFYMDWMEPESELDALVSAFGDELKESNAMKALIPMLNMANETRFLQVEQGIKGMDFRQLKQWVSNYLDYGDLGLAFCDAYLSQLEPNEIGLLQSKYTDICVAPLVLPTDLQGASASLAKAKEKLKTLKI